MTEDQARNAIIAAGCGWRSASEKVCAAADATPGYCNRTHCRSLALAANRAGVTAEDLGAAVAEYVAGDDASLLAILSG